MKKILLIGLFVLVATLGLSVASAAELNNSTAGEIVSIEQESTVIESIDQESVVSVNEEAVKSSSPTGIAKNKFPFGDEPGNIAKGPGSDPQNNNDNIIIGGGSRTTNDVHKTNGTNTGHPHNFDNEINKTAGPANPGNISEEAKEPTILYKTKTFDYKGEKVFLAIIDNNDGTGQKLVSYKASGGLNFAGGSVVSETGEDLVKLLEDTGVIKKVAYGAAWLTVKMERFFCDLFDDPTPINDENEEMYIILLAFGKEAANKYIMSH